MLQPSARDPSTPMVPWPRNSELVVESGVSDIAELVIGIYIQP